MLEFVKVYMRLFKNMLEFVKVYMRLFKNMLEFVKVYMKQIKSAIVCLIYSYPFTYQILSPRGGTEKMRS